jgi:molybdopterin converting factor small subunit
MITVNLHAVFAVETGLKTFNLDTADGSTAGKAILQIVDLYPTLRKYWVTEDGGLSDHVLVVLNGIEIYTQPDGLQTILKSGDRLDFFSPLAGG